MTTPTSPSDGERPPTSFIAIIDVSDTVADSVLEELTREGIAAYAQPLTTESDPLTQDSHSAVRIHVDRTRVPIARAIITSRLPQAGADFLSPRDTAPAQMSTEQVDQAWAQLVQQWQPGDDQPTTGSGLSSRLIRQHNSDPGSTADPLATSDPQRSEVDIPGSGPRDYSLDHDVLADEDERFVPPEPPPLPRPRHTWDIVGWSGAIGGPTLLVANQVLSWGSWLSGVGVAAFMGGFIVLVARMRNERDHDDPGAVV